MEKKQLKQLEKALLHLKKTLLEMEEEYKSTADTVELDQTRLGRLTRMDAMQAQQMALEASRRRQCKIQQADAALRRIGAGTFGYCYECGEEIYIKRLAAEPTSTHCVSCID